MTMAELLRELFNLGYLPGILQVAAVLSGQPLCKCSYCYPTVCKNNVTNYQETKKSSKRKRLSRHERDRRDKTKLHKRAVIAIYLAKSCFLQATSYALAKPLIWDSCFAFIRPHDKLESTTLHQKKIVDMNNEMTAFLLTLITDVQLPKALY